MINFKGDEFITHPILHGRWSFHMVDDIVEVMKEPRVEDKHAESYDLQVLVKRDAIEYLGQIFDLFQDLTCSINTFKNTYHSYLQLKVLIGPWIG